MVEERTLEMVRPLRSNSKSIMERKVATTAKRKVKAKPTAIKTHTAVWMASKRNSTSKRVMSVWVSL